MFQQTDGLPEVGQCRHGMRFLHFQAGSQQISEAGMNLVADIKEILASLIQFGTVGREGLVAAIEGIELLQHKKPTLTLREIRHQRVETFQHATGTIDR